MKKTILSLMYLFIIFLFSCNPPENTTSSSNNNGEINVLLAIKNIGAEGIDNYFGNIKFQNVILEFEILDDSIEIKEITLYRKNGSYPFGWIEIANFNNLLYVDDVSCISPTFNSSYTEAWYEYTFDLAYIKNNIEKKLELSAPEHIVVMDDIVFWTEYGNRYHKHGCYTISNSYKYFSSRQFAASYHGLTQCQICRP